MPVFHKSWLAAAIAIALVLSVGTANAQSGVGSGSLNGTVLDPSGAVVAGATVELHQAVSGYDRTTTTDGKGNFSFSNVPFNPYHMTGCGGSVGGARQCQDQSSNNRLFHHG
jgi:type 1 fimbria pilin